MTLRPDSPKRALPREIGDTGATIAFQTAPNGGTVIRVSYPQERRRQDRIVLRVICVLLGVGPVAAWLIFRHASMGWAIVALALAAALIGIPSSIIRDSRWSRSYVFVADSTGLRIETSNDQNVQRQSLARAQIADIQARFGRRRGRGTPACDSWLLIQAADSSSDIECLYDLGGDHLAHIADALRAALGMPKRSWP